MRDEKYLIWLEEIKILKSYLYMTGEKVEFNLTNIFDRKFEASLYCDEEMNFTLEITFVSKELKDEKIKSNLKSVDDFWWINRVKDLKESKSTKYPKSFSNKWSEILAEYITNTFLNKGVFSKKKNVSKNS